MNPRLPWALGLLLFGAPACDGGSGVPDAAAGDGADVVDSGEAADTADAPADEPADADGEADTDAEAGPPFDPDPDRMYADIERLASTEMGGRETGTPGNGLALDYVEGLFRSIGLEPAGAGGTYRFPFEFPRWTLNAAPTLEVDGTSLAYGDDYTVYRYSCSGAATGPLVFVGYGLVVPPFDPAAYPGCPLPATGYDDYDGLDVTGAVVLLLSGAHDGDTRILTGCPVAGKTQTAMERGAAGVLSVPDYRRPGNAVQGVVASLDGTASALPLFLLGRDAAERLLPDLPAWMATIDDGREPVAQATGLSVRVSVDATIATAVAENVVGVVPGSDPEHAGEVIVVGGHIDHEWPDLATGAIFPGADDNASGTAMTIELARGVAQGLVTPARTVVFAAWNAEESGIFGSCAWVDAPTYPIAATLAEFNMDAVGGGGGGGVYVIGGRTGPNGWLTDLMVDELLARGWSGAVQPMAMSEQSDHHCFVEAGVPVLSVMTIGDHSRCHTAADGIDGIVREDLLEGARLVWGVLERLATATEGPRPLPPCTLPPEWAPSRPGKESSS